MIELKKYDSAWEHFKSNVKKLSPTLSVTSCFSLSQSASLYESTISEEIMIDSRQELVWGMGRRQKNKKLKRVPPGPFKEQCAPKRSDVSL